MLTLVDLPPNKGFPFRKALFNRVSANPLVGVLRISEQKKNKEFAPTRKYAVSEDPERPADGVRYKVTKEGGEEWYFVLLASAGAGWDVCECRAHETGKQCVHAQALRRIFEKGGFG